MHRAYLFFLDDYFSIIDDVATKASINVLMAEEHNKSILHNKEHDLFKKLRPVPRAGQAGMFAHLYSTMEQYSGAIIPEDFIELQATECLALLQEMEYPNDVRVVIDFIEHLKNKGKVCYIVSDLTGVILEWKLHSLGMLHLFDHNHIATHDSINKISISDVIQNYELSMSQEPIDDSDSLKHYKAAQFFKLALNDFAVVSSQKEPLFQFKEHILVSYYLNKDG